jgi:CO/xanthine dehydrogenase FAD-binding subunit
MMAFYKPKSMKELTSILDANRNKFYFLAGGTDINVQRKNGVITLEDIIYINHLSELKTITETKNFIKIGCLTTFRDIIESRLMIKKLPYFRDSLMMFASPLLQTMATIGGNLANGSPTADVVPLLLVLNAKLELFSSKGSRIVEVSDFFTGYKKFNMRSNEFIQSILIPFDGKLDFDEKYYRKIGARATLTIAKVALAGLKRVKNGAMDEIRLAVGSLNEYPRRLEKVEEYLTGKSEKQINMLKVDFFLRNEITPISDLRSDKEYRYQVCFNLLKEFIQK